MGKQKRKTMGVWKHLRQEYQQLEKPDRRTLVLLSGKIFGYAVIAAVALRLLDSGFGMALSGILSLF